VDVNEFKIVETKKIENILENLAAKDKRYDEFKSNMKEILKIEDIKTAQDDKSLVCF
jgi:hypothetical protein